MIYRADGVWRGRWGIAIALGMMAVAAVPGSIVAQVARDTVVVAGPQYAAGELKEKLLGDDYRDLWLAPIRATLLDLGSFAGGLTPTERGGGLQTISLRFRGADGREYSFRSVNKFPDLTTVPALEGTWVGSIIQDQVSSLHPTAALVIPTLFSAVSVPHVAPQLFVMPDDPRLGEFRADFAGMLGQIEERPEDVGDGGVGFRLPPFGRIINTDRLLERLEESAEDRVDSRTYLTARLMDLLIGDWDRHEDQWRWGELDRDGYRLWVPIPRDRDYAFVDYDGLLMDALRLGVPNAVEFTPHIRNVPGLTFNARALDRHLLSDLDRRTWDSVTTSVQRRITDEVIDRALLSAPREHHIRNTEIGSNLKTRREDLWRAAERYYYLLSSEVDIRATDDRDLALIDRTDEESVVVRLFDVDSEGEADEEPYFERRFVAGETYEVRVYLHGADDRVIVRGDVTRTLMVRVIGGGGDDFLADSSTVRGGVTKTAFYDGRGDNVFVRGLRTAVEDENFQPPEPTRELLGFSDRDFGASYRLVPSVGYDGQDGIIVGGGPSYTRYGFWKDPYAYHLTAQGLIGLRTGNVAVHVSGDYRNTASRSGYSFQVSGSELESIRFHGFGNETVANNAASYYVVREDQLLGQANIHIGLVGGGRLGVGPIVKYTKSETNEGTPFDLENPYGEGFGQVGGMTELEYDFRDSQGFPRNGAHVRVGASGYPALWDADAFAETHATVGLYLTPSFIWQPTLAIRLGAKKIWGDYPVHEAAFLGGSRTLRGYRFQRFAGDASAYGSAELRAPLFNVKLIVRGTLGVLGVADVGRVYLDGEPSNEWHTASGGGVWFRFAIRESTLGATVTHVVGETNRIYLKLGAPF